MLPDFIIIGAQKAASTLLVECLRQHPDCYMPRGETQFFRDPFYREQTLADLEAVFDGQEHVQRRGIKCPDYLGSPSVPPRVAEHVPGADLVVVLRDPVKRAVSAYYWWMRWGGLPLEPLDEGMQRLLAGERREEHPDAHLILEYGLYARHLRTWLDSFDRSQVHVMLDEDFRSDEGAAIDRVFRALGLREGVRPSALGADQNAGVYSFERLRWLRRRNKLVARRDPMTGGLLLQRPTRPVPFVHNAAIVLTDRLLLSRLHDNARPALAPELERQLRDYYREDVMDLEGLLDRDLSAWR